MIHILVNSITTTELVILTCSIVGVVVHHTQRIALSVENNLTILIHHNRSSLAGSKELVTFFFTHVLYC